MMEPYYQKEDNVMNDNARAQTQLNSTPTGQPMEPVSRKRMKELHEIAFQCIEFLEEKGVKTKEGCEIRGVIETYWYRPKG